MKKKEKKSFKDFITSIKEKDRADNINTEKDIEYSEFEDKVAGKTLSVLSLFKNPKVLLIILLIWYIETPMIILFKKGLGVSLFGLYLNPIKLSIEFITSWSIIFSFIKFNIFFLIIFIIYCIVMDKTGHTTGKVIDVEKLKMLPDLFDKEKIKYSKREDYGSSHWADARDIEKANSESFSKERLKISKTGDDGVILGYFGDIPNVKKDSTPILTLPKKSDRNRNIAAFGSSGSMKSRSFVILNILNMIKNGESFFATDPKGELLAKTSGVLKKHGYNVRTFNLNNVPCSDRWNPVKEVKTPEDAAIFAEAIILNTNGGDGGDEFWTNHYTNLLKALVLYIVNNLPDSEQNLATLYKYITINGGFEKLKVEIGADIESDPLHPAYESWNTIATAAANEKVSSGVLAGLSTKLALLQIPAFRDMLSGTDIDLELPGQQKTAVFLVVPDSHSTFDFLAGLFFTFAFIKLTALADSLKTKELPVFVNFVFDEFPNISKVPSIEKKMATVRSRGIAIWIIFQNITQLFARYTKETGMDLLGNCDTKIFLGANEMETSKFISEMLGFTTIEVETESKETFSMMANRRSKGVARRELKTPDEVYNKPSKNSYVKMNGIQPIMCTKMDYSMHDLGGEVRDTPIYELLKDWSKPYHKDFLFQRISQIEKVLGINSNEEVNDSSKKEELFKELGVISISNFKVEEFGDNEIDTMAKKLGGLKNILGVNTGIEFSNDLDEKELESLRKDLEIMQGFVKSLDDEKITIEKNIDLKLDLYEKTLAEGTVSQEDLVDCKETLSLIQELATDVQLERIELLELEIKNAYQKLEEQKSVEDAKRIAGEVSTLINKIKTHGLEYVLNKCSEIDISTLTAMQQGIINKELNTITTKGVKEIRGIIKLGDYNTARSLISLLESMNFVDGDSKAIIELNDFLETESEKSFNNEKAKTDETEEAKTDETEEVKTETTENITPANDEIQKTNSENKSNVDSSMADANSKDTTKEEDPQDLSQDNHNEDISKVKVEDINTSTDKIEDDSLKKEKVVLIKDKKESVETDKIDVITQDNQKTKGDSKSEKPKVQIENKKTSNNNKSNNSLSIKEENMNRKSDMLKISEKISKTCYNENSENKANDKSCASENTKGKESVLDKQKIVVDNNELDGFTTI